MKNCPDCAGHELHLKTVLITVEASAGKQEECRRLGHVPWKRIEGKHDICLNCLRHGWATLKVLADVIQNPCDLMGRPIMNSESDPQQGGLWPGMKPRRSIATILGWVFLGALALASMAALSWYLTTYGPHLR